MTTTMSNIAYPPETNSGVVTSYIPLTSSWSSHPGCASSFRLDGPSLMAFDPGYGIDVDTNVRCLPPAMTTWWEQGLLGGSGARQTHVSIGPLTCPDDWTTVASSTKDSISTLAMCCPQGYSLLGQEKNKVDGDCISDVSSGMALTYGSSASTDTHSWSIATTTLTDTSTVGAVGMVGWNINPSTSPPAASASATKSATPTPTTTGQKSNSGSRSGSSGLSTSAKVGVGVGVGVGAVGIIALLLTVFFIRRIGKPLSSLSRADATAFANPSSMAQPVAAGGLSPEDSMWHPWYELEGKNLPMQMSRAFNSMRDRAEME